MPRYRHGMGEDAKRWLEAFMALAEDERELVSVELNLLRDVCAEVGHDPQREEAWTREIERRVEQVRRGTVTLRSWEEVRAELRARRASS